MNLYTNIDQNIRRTWFLISIFLVVVIGLGWFFSYLLDSQAILVVAVIFSVLMSVGSYWWSDKLVLKMSKAKEIKFSENKDLYRLLENLSVSAGLPMPKFYIIEDPSPNGGENTGIAWNTSLVECLLSLALPKPWRRRVSHPSTEERIQALRGIQV